jgi:hypothetical protein
MPVSSTAPVVGLPPSAPPADPPKTAEPREYIVFKYVNTPDGRGLNEVGRATATTKTAARDEVVDRLPEERRGDPFVTLPAKACVPQTAKETRDVKPGRTVIRRVWS